jgi:prepilin-type N-terminal cleavage/methylation domain-containing protein
MTSTRKGFTFVELVVCLSLILIVTALLMPGFTRARARARGAACSSNLAQIGSALQLYAQDHDGRFPPDERTWSYQIQAYAKNTMIVQCPSEPEGLRKKYAVARGVTLPNGTELLPGSYQYRAGLANDDPSSTAIAADWEPWHLGGAYVVNVGVQIRWVPSSQMPHLQKEPRSVPPTGAAIQPEKKPEEEE